VSILHRRRNRSGHGRTILSRSWDVITRSTFVWSRIAVVKFGRVRTKVHTHNYDLRSVRLNFQALESQFEAEVQWERLLTPKNNKVQIFAARFARELFTSSPPTSRWAWPSGDCFRWPCFDVLCKHFTMQLLFYGSLTAVLLLLSLSLPSVLLVTLTNGHCMLHQKQWHS